EEREELRVARDLELGHLEHVEDGLALDVREVLEHVRFARREADAPGELPVEVLELDLVRGGEVLLYVCHGSVPPAEPTSRRAPRIKPRGFFSRLERALVAETPPSTRDRRRQDHLLPLTSPDLTFSTFRAVTGSP